MIKEISKQKDYAFNKDVYLLGKDKEGVRYWLEAPSWDCKRYWGFGYIETYQSNRKPSTARDIDSHQHATDFMSEYFINWNGSEPILKERTFTEKEGWILSELFKQFYHWKEHAEVIGRGGCHCVSIPNIEWYKNNKRYYEIETSDINKNIIPDIMNRIIKILSPKTS